ncbi:alpha/beta fold hydrolase [Halosegnis rubeus]|uniref:Alpha/beta fold hydrolase n=1 Tax=Halosegnis rubeus TaxID=2212850 RepID=A0A5N5UC80_9EURY|nr:alpha/beta hydrolase [Halosegnis rubeus]KAB7515164.1 alpha/beta fold hydrolase [Halosegnis rubeus]KAB7516218.1 alpha/beta fold hydrolase [Halosegnis rubeus]KAB7517524.1 alpha/beta fold hydrolase [Halosegnis rubeus]
MPRARHDGIELYYEQVGSGDTVVFLPEAGLGAWSWGWQHDAVAGPFESLVVDPRGTGRSDAADDYGVETLAADLEAVLRDANVRSAHLVGHGLGGAVAVAYAREYNRARSLALVTTPAAGDVVDTDALGRLFSDEWPSVAFSESYVGVAPRDEIEGWRRLDDADADAREQLFAAYRAFDPGALYEITVPTLVLGALDSPVIPEPACETLAQGLPRGEYEQVEGRHLAHLEHSRAVNDRLLQFLEE